jgi:diguanylate cyclase (GGDEF)-like protein/PAS domain S-box-containing protein
MKNYRWILVRILGCLLVLLSQPAVALYKVKLELKWFHQFQFAGFYVAKEKNFYKDAGLDVEIIERDIKSTPLADVLSDKVQFGISDTTLIRHKLDGKKVILLAAIYQHSPLVLISLDKNKIYSPLELKNKKVMYQKGIDDAIIVGMFENQGLSKHDFSAIAHTFKDDALLTQDIDAMSAYLGDQTYYYESKGYHLNIINPANYGLDLYGDLLFTSESFFKNHTQQALAFRKASIRGWIYALEHPQEAINIILSKYSTQKTKAQLLHEAKHIKAMIAPTVIDVGHVNPNRLQRIKTIYQSWLPELKHESIEGLLYSEHLNKESRDLLILGLSLTIAATLILISSAIAFKWKRRAQEINSKFSSTSRKLGSFQDVILHKFDTMTIDLEGKITFISNGLLKSLGYVRPKILGHQLTNFLVNDKENYTVETIAEEIRRKGVWQGEMLLFANDRKKRIYHSLIDEQSNLNGDICGYIVIYIDQTEKVLAQQQAITDPLTTLYNRYHLDKVLCLETEKATRYKNPLSILLLDLDHFKTINDTHGHLKGDEVIREVSLILQKASRATDIVGRWGGEEFLIICPNTTADTSLILGQRVQGSLQKLKIKGLDEITVSGGIADFKPGSSIEDFINRADKALYQAKSDGRNKIVIE